MIIDAMGKMAHIPVMFGVAMTWLGRTCTMWGRCDRAARMRQVVPAPSRRWLR
eukprot:SAG25_NODE_3838_length_954_cov_1.077193_1_plen_52_part_01